VESLNEQESEENVYDDLEEDVIGSDRENESEDSECIKIAVQSVLAGGCILSPDLMEMQTMYQRVPHPRYLSKLSTSYLNQTLKQVIASLQ
jgi:hypothetical protein